MFLPATDGNDLLQIAEALCTRAGMAVPLDSLQETAVRSFCGRRFEQASALFAEVLERRETSDVWCDWATALTICEDTSGAERGFRRALDLNAGNDLAALKLGVLLAGSNGMPTLFITWSNAAIAVKSRSAPKYCNCWRRAGRSTRRRLLPD